MRVQAPPVNTTTRTFARTANGLFPCNAEEAVAVRKYKCRPYRTVWFAVVAFAASVMTVGLTIGG